MQRSGGESGGQVPRTPQSAWGGLRNTLSNIAEEPQISQVFDYQTDERHAMFRGSNVERLCSCLDCARF
jgi:hypothetical protein